MRPAGRRRRIARGGGRRSRRHAPRYRAARRGAPASRWRRGREAIDDAAPDRASSSPLAAADPAPATELAYVDPYTLLVAVILSAQATDAGVNKATAQLFKVADTPAKMVALGEEGLRQYIKTIGLFNIKAKAIIAMSRALLEEHGGEVPGDREALEKLPGVGRKTANVVLNSAFGQPTIAVDTHVFRVANRTGLAPGKTPLEVERGLEAAGAEEIRPLRPSLADPARPLRLHRAQAQLPGLRGPRPLRLPGQDALASPDVMVPATARSRRREASPRTGVLTRRRSSGEDTIAARGSASGPRDAAPQDRCHRAASWPRRERDRRSRHHTGCRCRASRGIRPWSGPLPAPGESAATRSSDRSAATREGHALTFLQPWAPQDQLRPGPCDPGNPCASQPLAAQSPTVSMDQPKKGSMLERLRSG